MNWMTNLYNTEPAFSDRPLSEITLPGTHDAGCYIDRVVNFRARTQLQTIGQQLSGGIRYFDIRPKFTQNQEYWTYHGPYYGGRIGGENGILQDVAQYMNSLPASARELVILNISHFSGFNDNAHRDLILLIKEKLGSHLIQYTQANLNLFNASYENLLKDNRNQVRSRVAIIYDGALDQDRIAYVSNTALPEGFFKLSPKYNVGLNAQNSVYLFDLYSNSWYVADYMGRSGMRSKQLNMLTHRDEYRYTGEDWGAGMSNWTPDCTGPGGVVDTMHLLSWTLTPQLRAWANPISAAQEEANPALLPFFNQFNGWQNGASYDIRSDPKINIIYSDVYESETVNSQNANRNGMAMPVGISDFLNRYLNAQGQVVWNGWNGF